MSKPNVVILLTDDQGYGDLECHGHPALKTPNFNKLHSESIRMTDFHVVPMCAPTRGSLMTGQDCIRNGAMATSLGRHLPDPDLTMMPQVFKNSGYRTGIFGKWHLGSSYPYLPHHRGFDEAIYHLGFGLTGADDKWNNDYFDPWYRHNGELKQARGYCTDFWFDSAMKWIGECQDEGKPFFCYLPTNVPHFPMWVDDCYKEAYACYGGDPSGFFGMIVELDENLARFEQFLKERGLRDDTIFIYMTDNGHAGKALDVYNAGMRGGKCSRYDGGHRVPCFVRWPNGKLTDPCDIDTPTQVQDILPTLIDLCGLARPDGVQKFDGSSFAPLLRGEEMPELEDRMFVVQYFQNDI
ncbi:MAG: arylsulfatase, partial [Candidatus Sumerlaeota bacterium]